MCIWVPHQEPHLTSQELRPTKEVQSLQAVLPEVSRIASQVGGDGRGLLPRLPPFRFCTCPIFQLHGPPKSAAVMSPRLCLPDPQRGTGCALLSLTHSFRVFSTAAPSGPQGHKAFYFTVVSFPGQSRDGRTCPTHAESPDAQAAMTPSNISTPLQACSLH